MNANQYIILVLLAVLPACTSKVDNGGYVTDVAIKDQIKPGESKQEVLATLGSPSSQSDFGTETWYYVTDRKETVAFFKPEVADQHVVSVEFDSGGAVSAIKDYTKDDAKDVAMVRRTTPTEGHSMGIVEQLLGNVGRFNKPGGDSNSAAPGRRPSTSGPF